MVCKIISAYILIFLLCLPLCAQTEKFKPELAIGINAGTTFSKMSFARRRGWVYPQELLMQYAGGISVRYVSEKNVGLLGEINYSQRGWEEKTEDFPDHKYIRSLDYLEIPLFTHIYFNTGKRGRIIFNLGPQFSFLLDDKVKERMLDITPFVTREEDTFTYYDMKAQNKFDWGVCAGAGFELRTGIGSFVLDGRFYFGLSDIFDNSAADHFSRSANQVITAKLTYYIRK